MPACVVVGTSNFLDVCRPAATEMAASSHSYRELAFLILPIYLPALLAVLAQAIVISVLPIFVQDDLSGDDAATGTIVSMQGLGAFMTAGFAGFVIARVGDRCGMLVGAGLRSAAYVASWLVTLLPTSTDGGAAMLLLGCARFGTGMGMSTFQVARNSWVNGAVPKTLRGRANGLIGGCARVSNTIGPAVGGVLDQYAGAPLAFFGQVLLGIVNVVVLSFCVPRSSPERHGSSSQGGGDDSGLRRAANTATSILVLLLPRPPPTSPHDRTRRL